MGAGGCYETRPVSRKPVSSIGACITGPVSWERVKEHCSADSCWIVVRNKVYDVTSFAPNHPGGRAIYSYAGRDATDVFSAFHRGSTWSILRDYYVGDLEEWVNAFWGLAQSEIWVLSAGARPGVGSVAFSTYKQKTTFEKPSILSSEAVVTQDRMLAAFRHMRAQMVRAGLFKSSKSFYTWKLVSLMALFATAAAVLINGAGAWSSCLVSSFILALGWQQAGWLAHDFLHHQVFQNRLLNTAFGYFFGNVVQGFSVRWWKDKHNTHHAVPNEFTCEGKAVDPDIDTVPFLVWHEDMAEGVSKTVRNLLKLQHFLFFPVLCFARIAWAQQSLQSAILLSRISWHGALEVFLIFLHYALTATVAALNLPVRKAVVFLLLSQVWAGLMLAIVFVQSHNAMEVYTEKKDFVSAQLLTTRNINSSLWMDWFSGGLNFQIEHHLFPTLPRHNLERAKSLVMRFCQEHKFVYESCGMDTGTFRVLQRLSAIASVL